MERWRPLVAGPGRRLSGMHIASSAAEQIRSCRRLTCRNDPTPLSVGRMREMQVYDSIGQSTLLWAAEAASAPSLRLKSPGGSGPGEPIGVACHRACPRDSPACVMPEL